VVVVVVVVSVDVASVVVDEDSEAVDVGPVVVDVLSVASAVDGSLVGESVSVSSGFEEHAASGKTASAL